MKTSISLGARGPMPITRFYTGFRRFGVLVAFIAILAATLYSTSSASHSSKLARRPSDSVSNSALPSRSAVVDRKDRGTSLGEIRAEMNHGSMASLPAGWLAPPAPVQSPPVVESIATYAPDCETPKTSFVLGETICARVTNAFLDVTVQRRISWVDPDGFIRQTVDVTTDPQTNTLLIPTSDTTTFNDGISSLTVNNRGTWTVNTITSSDAGLVSSASFTVGDPAQPAVDLSVGVNQVGNSPAPASGNVAFTLELSNKGPDTATSVQLSSPVPNDTTFVSIVQTSGPAFTCVDPGAGNTGTTVCSGANLGPDASATFTVIYQVVSGTPNGTTISGSATVNNAVSDLRAPNDTGIGEAVVGPATCSVTCPADITMGNDHDSFGAIVTFAASTPTGVCGTVTTTPSSGSFFPVGTTTVTSAGESGSPCSFHVTINDTQKPVIACPADITRQEDAPGSGSAVVNYAPPSVVDNDPAGAPATCDHPSGSSFPVGETIVTCTATDAAGNVSDPCSFKVTVTGDGSACSLSCPADITVEADNGSCGANVTYPDATVNDQCGTLTYSTPSGSFFPVGTTTVTVSSSTSRSCSFRVKVEDKQNPTVTAPADKNADAGATSCEAAVNVGTATASDNCPTGLTVSGARDDGDPLNAPYPVGTTVITWTATDGAGNTATATQNVKVRDTIAPNVNLVPSITLDASADTCQVEVPEVLDLQSSVEGRYGTASDNCAGPDRLVIRQVPAAGTLVSAGDHTITVTVYDGDPDDPDAPPPNHTTKQTVLHVRDVTPPTIALNGANPLTVECHTTFADPGATATDACAGSFAATPSGVVDMETPGTYTVTYNASDPSGNAATPVTRTVIVVDTTPPTLTLNGQTITLWPPNHQYQVVRVTDLVASASDGCDETINIDDVYITKVTSDEVENGTGDGNTLNDIVIGGDCKSVQLRAERNGGGDGRVYKITFKVVDASGNATTATAQVNVPKSPGSNVVDSGAHYTVTSSCP
jgi:uncharacterized repeat protein (TIGR01451 family)